MFSLQKIEEKNKCVFATYKHTTQTWYFFVFTSWNSYVFLKWTSIALTGCVLFGVTWFNLIWFDVL